MKKYRTLHIRPETFKRLYDDFMVRCTQDEMVDAMLDVLEQANESPDDFTQMILDYRYKNTVILPRKENDSGH
jgi:hypothetical protein